MMKQVKIYLLDDDPDVLSLLSDMVEDIDMFAESYDQGQVFFEKIKNTEENSLMVLDLNMPEMDGIEVMRRLSVMKSPPSLILISGHDVGVLHSAEKLGKAHELNVIASINKPIIMKEFHLLITDYCKSINVEKKICKNRVSDEIQHDELLYAINNDQMVLYYQPQISIRTMKCISCEALIRWQHPTKGMIFPDQFIAIAEANGWMEALTNWVIKEAVDQELDWQASGFHVPVSVNVSADNITSLSLPEQVSELLNKKKLNPTMLTLEVTESALMGELVTSLDILTRLRLKGLGLSIDDFGTGYSCLSYLLDLPVSTLKIDGSFIR